MFDLSVIKFSVNWWDTLHQPAAVFRMDGPTIHPSLHIAAVRRLAARQDRGA